VSPVAATKFRFPFYLVTESYTFPDPPQLSDSFVSRIRDVLQGLIPLTDCSLLVALSGGPDSTSLLAVLKSLAKMAGDKMRLEACHLNHGLRGAESDEDQRFCEELCRHWQVPLAVKRLSGNVRSEAALREARYAVLVAQAERSASDCVLTGHTLDDQVETVLFRLFRGSSPRRLVGIPPKRPLSPGVELVRPMLLVERTDVTGFLSRIGLPARQDSSNRLTGYGRNYIRRRIVPQVRERFPSFNRSIERMRSLLEEDERLLNDLATAAHEVVAHAENEWLLPQLNDQPLTIKRRMIAEALRQRNIEVTFDRTNAVIDLANQGKGALALDAYWELRAQRKMLFWNFAPDDDVAVPDPELIAPAALQIPGLTVSLALQAAVQVDKLNNTWLPEEEDFPAAESSEAIVDLSQVEMPLCLRLRKAGDSIHPFGMDRSVKLRKYLHTHRSDALINPVRSIVVANGDDVLWVPGVGISNKLKVTGKPTHRLRFMHLSEDSV
jgi:tRNA(Ile)-lysidine synthase